MFERIPILFEYWLASRRPIELVRMQVRDQLPNPARGLVELKHIRFMLQQEWLLRNGRFRRGYWRMLPPMDQFIAEAESEWLLDEIERVWRAEQAWAEHELESLDVDAIDVDSMVKHMHMKMHNIGKANELDRKIATDPNNPLTSRDARKRQLEFGLAEQLLPFDHPNLNVEMTRYFSPIMEGHDESLLDHYPDPDAAADLRAYRHSSYGIQSHLRQSFDCLIFDLEKARAESNQLTGASAKNNTLLTNGWIPMPNEASIGAWLSHCSLAFRRLSPKEGDNAKNLCGFKPHFILTFMPPFMPMTKEHLSHSLVSTEDSQAAWSLSAKSKGHDRDELGRLKYGRWMAITVLLGEKNQLYFPVAEQINNVEESSIAIHERHLDLLPGFESSIHQLMVGKTERFWMLEHAYKPHVTRLKKFVANPNMTDLEWLPLLPMTRYDNIIFPWASMSKYLGMHFRFDEEDEDAWIQWCGNFIALAHWHIMASPLERQVQIFQRFVDADLNVLQPDMVKTVKKDGLNLRFDLGDI